MRSGQNRLAHLSITTEMVLNGLRKGYVRLIEDPNMEAGTVCAIGDSWFYFGGMTAEEESPEEYLRHVPLEDIAQEICAVLEDFRRQEYFLEEWRYYAYYLREHGCIPA